MQTKMLVNEGKRVCSGQSKIMCEDPDTTESIAFWGTEGSSVRLALRIGVVVLVVVDRQGG